MKEGELKLAGGLGSEGGVNWSWQEAGGLHISHLKPASWYLNTSLYIPKVLWANTRIVGHQVIGHQSSR